MPSVHIWVKKEDWDRWQAITNKPEWLHEHLNDIGIRTAVALEDIKQGQAGTVMGAKDLGKTLYPMPKGKDLSELFKDVDIDDGVDVITYTQPEDTA